MRIATGILCDEASNVLLALRGTGKTHASLWELPGGKAERGEHSYAALCRELGEELGIAVESAHRFARLQKSYPDRRVLVDAWWVDGFRGSLRGNEGQWIEWFHPEEALGLAAVPSAKQLIRRLAAAKGRSQRLLSDKLPDRDGLSAPRVGLMKIFCASFAR